MMSGDTTRGQSLKSLDREATIVFFVSVFFYVASIAIAKHTDSMDRWTASSYLAIVAIVLTWWSAFRSIPLWSANRLRPMAFAGRWAFAALTTYRLVLWLLKG